MKRSWSRDNDIRITAAMQEALRAFDTARDEHGTRFTTPEALGCAISPAILDAMTCGPRFWLDETRVRGVRMWRLTPEGEAILAWLNSLSSPKRRADGVCSLCGSNKRPLKRTGQQPDAEMYYRLKAFRTTRRPPVVIVTERQRVHPFSRIVRWLRRHLGLASKLPLQ